VAHSKKRGGKNRNNFGSKRLGSCITISSCRTRDFRKTQLALSQVGRKGRRTQRCRRGKGRRCIVSSTILQEKRRRDNQDTYKSKEPKSSINLKRRGRKKKKRRQKVMEHRGGGKGGCQKKKTSSLNKKKHINGLEDKNTQEDSILAE